MPIAAIILPPTHLLSLAWRPFLEPLPLDDYWLILLIPMIVAVSVVYKTIRIDDLAELPRQAAYLALQIAAFMAMAAAALWLLLFVV